MSDWGKDGERWLNTLDARNYPLATGSMLVEVACVALFPKSSLPSKQVIYDWGNACLGDVG